MGNAEHTESSLAWLLGPSAHAAIQIHSRGVKAQPGQCSFFAPDFALNSAQPWLWGEETEVQLAPLSLPALTQRAGPSSAEFSLMHEEILRRIEQHEFAKVVPIVCEELEFAGPLHAAMFAKTIQQTHPQQFNYGFEFSGEGMCGVTPELLFSVRDGVLQTMALAGTGAANGPSLLADAKEMHEHELVIEHITGELRHWGVAATGPTEERNYGALKHLFTPIELRLAEPPSFMELVVRLHPTAALGGWPRRPAVEWLERQDFHLGRKRFGAPFGYVKGGEMACVVAIRGLQWRGTRALLSAGAGIVAGSQALREWEELQLKRRATRELLGLEI